MCKCSVKERENACCNTTMTHNNTTHILVINILNKSSLQFTRSILRCTSQTLQNMLQLCLRTTINKQIKSHYVIFSRKTWKMETLCSIKNIIMRDYTLQTRNTESTLGHLQEQRAISMCKYYLTILNSNTLIILMKLNLLGINKTLSRSGVKQSGRGHINDTPAWPCNLKETDAESVEFLRSIH